MFERVIGTALGVLLGGLTLWAVISWRQQIARGFVSSCRALRSRQRDVVCWTRHHRRLLKIAFGVTMGVCLVQAPLWWKMFGLADEARRLDYVKLARMPLEARRTPRPIPSEPSDILEPLPAVFRSLTSTGYLIRIYRHNRHVSQIRESTDPPFGFDPFEGIEGTIFELYPHSLVGVESAEEREQIRLFLEARSKDANTVYQLGAAAIPAGLLVAILDPVAWLAAGLGGAVAARFSPYRARGAAVTRSPEAIAARRWPQSTDAAEATLRAWLDKGQPSHRFARLYALESADGNCGNVSLEVLLVEAERLVEGAIRSPIASGARRS